MAKGLKAAKPVAPIIGDAMDVDSFLDGGFEGPGATDIEVKAVKVSKKKDKKLSASPATKTKRSDPSPERVSKVPAIAKVQAKKRKTETKADAAVAEAASKKSRTVPTKTAGKAASKKSVAKPDDEDSDGELRSEVKSHKQQLAALKAADPEFFQYLEESDKTLLEFESDEDVLSDGDEDEDEDVNAMEVDEDGDEDVLPETSQSPAGFMEAGQVEKWCRGAQEDASLGSIKHVIKAFRAACHYGDAEKDDSGGNLHIMSNAAFQKTLLFCLKEADSFFRRLLDMVGTTTVTEANFKNNKWRKASALVKSYLGNALHLLTHLAEEHTSTFILRRLRASVIFLLPFESLQRKYLKLILGLFGSSPSRRVRLQALLWLRAYAMALPRKALNEVLKGAYRTYAANARFVTSSSLPDISFMAASLVELYGLNAGASYEHAFGFIAQLAVLLRNALTLKTVDAYRDVYSWRAINCLELWGRILAAHAHLPELRPLVYPVAQLLLGAAKLVPSPRWFPVRLRLVRMLNALSSATGTYMPVSSLLLEVLSWQDLKKPAKGGAKCPDLLLQLRLSKANLKQPSVQAEVVDTALELLASSLALWSKNPGFPELTHLPLVALKKFIKASPVERFRRQAKLLQDSIEANGRVVGLARDAANFAPKDVSLVSDFMKDEDTSKLPLVAYAHRLQEKSAERRAAFAASHVTLNERQSMASDDDDEDSEIDAEEMEEQLLPKKKASKSNYITPPLPAPPPKTDEAIEHEDDIIEEYVLSEDEGPSDEDIAEDERPKKVVHHKPAGGGKRVGSADSSKRGSSGGGRGRGGGGSRGGRRK